MPEARPAKVVAPAQDIARGTLLGFDFGDRRIGVAVGDRETGLAHPVGIIAADNDARRFAAIEALICEWQPTWFVVGVPTSEAGGEHSFAPRCRHFARQLAGRFGLPVTEVDEAFSSAAAALSLAHAGVRGIRQKAHLDAVAAQTLLQDFLDSERRRPA